MLIDAHLDLAYNAVLRGRDITQPASDQPVVENEIATVGLPDLRDAGASHIFATIFCQPQSSRHAGYITPDEAFDQALAQLGYYRRLSEKGLLNIQGASRPNSGINTTLLLEGADAIRDEADLDMMHRDGVRIVGLSWSRTRYAGGTGAPGPVTDAGKQLIKWLDARDIIHDASHLSDTSFWDLMGLSNKLVIASHSNCRVIVGQDIRQRHLTDEMIRAIAERNGVIGINFFDRFLLPHDQYGRRRATLGDVVAHIRRICDLTQSTQFVGIGTDMDGGLGREQIPQDIATAGDLPRLRDTLARAGFATADIDRIMFGNWRRVINQLTPELR
jgi:membrane dipeptidase